jgi:DNA modification methylase
MKFEALVGDWVSVLKAIPDESVNCAVTSPPYWGLRDYGVDDQLGLEKTPEEYVEKLVVGFREVRRVLRADGTLWLNLGDSYISARGRKSSCPQTVSGKRSRGEPIDNNRPDQLGHSYLKDKDLCGIPWRVAFALQADGWWLRSDIIWHKPNPMPESVHDRPTKSHEYVFLLTKSAKYYYDFLAIREKCIRAGTIPGGSIKTCATAKVPGMGKQHLDKAAKKPVPEFRNRRSVWTIATQPFKESHFATFPQKLAETCILGGCPEGGTVLDPFAGTCTVGLMCAKHNRDFIGIDLKLDYLKMREVEIEKLRQSKESE